MFHYAQYRDGMPDRWVVAGDETEDLDDAVPEVMRFKAENPDFTDEDVRIVSYLVPMTVDRIERTG